MLIQCFHCVSVWVVGFGDYQEAYSPYPNALLSVRYMTEVGNIIIGDEGLEAGEIKEGDNLATGTNTGSKDTEDSVVGQIL